MHEKQIADYRHLHPAALAVLYNKLPLQRCVRFKAVIFEQLVIRLVQTRAPQVAHNEPACLFAACYITHFSHRDKSSNPVILLIIQQNRQLSKYSTKVPGVRVPSFTKFLAVRPFSLFARAKIQTSQKYEKISQHITTHRFLLIFRPRYL